MRTLTFWLCCLLPLPALAAGIGEEGARLLLQRTGFGAHPADIRALAPLSREQAVDQVLSGIRREAITPPPDWAGSWQVPERKNLSEAEQAAFRRQQVQQGLALRGWWLQEMATTPSPVSEKMTLFWHNHFVSGQDKVKLASLMYRQNTLLRREALGNFATLLHDIAKDPAMMRYLDTASNRAGQPNENFAREVMELFTLGEGHYQEQDIREAARAFTGWGLDLRDGRFVNRPRLHDSDSKTVLGHSGRLDGDDVLDILLKQPETSRFVTRKLWRYLVSPTPDEARITPLASRFAANYEIKPLVRALLLTPNFWQSAGQQVKSPVELTVGTLRSFEVPVADWRVVAMQTRAMGQDVFNPPNVRGWPGGEAWINSNSLLLRKQFIDRLLTPQDARPRTAPFDRGGLKLAEKMAERQLGLLRLDSQGWPQRYGLPPASLPTYLLAVPPATSANTVASLLRDPAYQVQ